MTDLHPHDHGHPWFQFALLLNRFVIGLFMLLAGTFKLNGGLVEFVNESFRSMQPDWLPDVLATPYGYAIPFLEIIVGALLIVGFLTRSAAVVGLLMILSFTIALTIAKESLVHGPGPFNANLIFIALLFLLAITGPGHLSIDHRIGSLKQQASPPDNKS